MRFVNWGLALQLLGLWFVMTQGGNATRVRVGALIAALIYMWRVGVLGELAQAAAARLCCCCGCCKRDARPPVEAAEAAAPPAVVERGRDGPGPGYCANMTVAVAEFFLSALPTWNAPQPLPEAQQEALRRAAA